VSRNLKVDLVNGGIKKARVSQGGKEYDIESISADAGEAQQVNAILACCLLHMKKRDKIWPWTSVDWNFSKRKTW
jgi:hypothetical protein